MKYIQTLVVVVFLTGAGLAHADLYCSDGELSPDQINGSKKMATTLQVDKMSSSNNIQLTYTDYYYDRGDHVINATWNGNQSDRPTEGIKHGTYKTVVDTKNPTPGVVTIKFQAMQSKTAPKVQVEAPNPWSAGNLLTFTCDQLGQ